MNVNQAINKQRKNVDGLLKFLLGYRYYEQDLSSLPTPSVPNEFEDFAHYQSCFQVNYYEVDSIAKFSIAIVNERVYFEHKCKSCDNEEAKRKQQIREMFDESLQQDWRNG